MKFQVLFLIILFRGSREISILRRKLASSFAKYEERKYDFTN